MTLPMLVRRSLRQHLLSTVVTAVSIALAGGLLMSVWVVKTESETVFTQVNAGFDAVLGARGSKL
ncbi:MAG TPA: ABC transporter permease, partial [Opitutaceae bacterium]|nr:ABC transporter permease [Opitutaceae bacterium]